MLEIVKKYMEEFQGLGQGEEDYDVSGLIELGGKNNATYRYGTEAVGNKLAVYIIIGLVKGEEGLVSWL